MSDETILSALARATPDDEINVLAIADPALTLRLVAANRDLASADSLWNADPNGVSALAEQANTDHLEPFGGSAVLSLLAQAAVCPQPPAGGAATTPAHLQPLLNAATLVTMLEAVASGQSCRTEVRETLRQSMTSLPKGVLVQALANGVGLRAATLLIELSPIAVLTDPAVAAGLPRVALRRAPLDVLVPLIATALDANDSQGELLATILPSVHNAVTQHRLPEEAWRSLEVHVPSVPSEHEWDRGLRLRLAVLVALRRWHVSLDSFRRILEDPGLGEVLQGTERQSKDKKQKNWLERIVPW